MSVKEKLSSLAKKPAAIFLPAMFLPSKGSGEWPVFGDGRKLPDIHRLRESAGAHLLPVPWVHDKAIEARSVGKGAQALRVLWFFRFLAAQMKT